LRPIDRRLARRERGDVGRRMGLRACASIAVGCRRATQGLATLDPTRAAIIALGNEGAARLRAIPDSPALRRHDRAVIALHPEAGRPSGPLVRRMAHLVARYREERDIDREALLLTLGAAYTAIRPAFLQQKQVGSPVHCPADSPGDCED
jgi:hypothetical protein